MRRFAIILAALMAALACAGCGSKCGDLPQTAAVVNGKPISCSDYVRQLNLQAGGQVLITMVRQAIIMEWAEKEGVAPTEEQIQNQIAVQKEEGLWEDEVKLFGKAGMDYRMRGDQARINLARKLIKFEDKEVEELYEQMKARFVHGPRKLVAGIVNPDKDKVDKALQAIKEGRSFEDAAEEFSVQTNVKLWVPEEDPEGNLPKDIVSAVKSLKVGETSKAVALPSMMGGPANHVILKVLRTQGAVNKKLKDVKDDLLDTLALQKSISDPDFQKKLEDKIKDAEWEVNIEQFKDLPKQMKSMPSGA